MVETLTGNLNGNIHNETLHQKETKNNFELIKAEEICEKINDNNIGTDFKFKRKLVWKNIIGFIYLHLIAIYGIYLALSNQSKFLTTPYALFLGWLSGEGITIGAHRLWTHRCFNATTTLRIILMILQTMAGQNCTWIWVRDHRQHHRYSDTDGDPHNATRGFFFSHMGWLMSRKHPLVIKLGKTINMDDLNADKIVMFQKEHYKKLYFLLAVFIPTAIPVYLWNETWMKSLCISYFARYILILHGTWCVNSIAHLYGNKPFDKNILPVESPIVSFIVSGEGWHNYHHVFPWDYKTAETGTPFQLSSHIIKVLEYLGMAYNLKQVSPETVKARILRTGDKNHLNNRLEKSR